MVASSLPSWVVFDCQLNLPDHIVACKQIVRRGFIEITDEVLLAETLLELHAKLPPNLTRNARHPMDERQMVEFWF